MPAARFVLPKQIPTFLERYPGVSVEVAMDNTIIDVIAAGYDAGGRYEESLAKDMIAVPIGPRRQRFSKAFRRCVRKESSPLHSRKPRSLCYLCCLDCACSGARFSGHSIRFSAHPFRCDPASSSDRLQTWECWPVIRDHYAVKDMSEHDIYKHIKNLLEERNVRWGRAV